MYTYHKQTYHKHTIKAHWKDSGLHFVFFLPASLSVINDRNKLNTQSCLFYSLIPTPLTGPIGHLPHLPSHWSPLSERYIHFPIKHVHWYSNGKDSLTKDYPSLKKVFPPVISLDIPMDWRAFFPPDTSSLTLPISPLTAPLWKVFSPDTSPLILPGTPRTAPL